MRAPRRIAATAAVAVLAVSVLAACSSSTPDPGEQAASMIEGASSAAAAAEEAGSPDMVALCDQMVADGLSPEDATALAESNGFAARVGTIDGEAQALTMDYRTDRFTFEVEGNVVVGCTYG